MTERRPKERVYLLPSSDHGYTVEERSHLLVLWEELCRVEIVEVASVEDLPYGDDVPTVLGLMVVPVDEGTRRSRLAKARAEAEQARARLVEPFLSRAPADVVQRQRDRLATAEEKVRQLELRA